MPLTTGSTTCSACSRRDGTFTAIWSRDDADEFSPAEEKRRVRAADRLHHGASGAGSDAARLSLRAVRADGAEAPDGSVRDARGRGRSAAPRGRHGRPAAAVRQSLRASVESYSIKKMEQFYRLSAGRSTCATRARASSPSRQWLELGEGDVPSDHPRPDRALQPRRRRQQPRCSGTGSRSGGRSVAAWPALDWSRPAAGRENQLPSAGVTEAQAGSRPCAARLTDACRPIRSSATGANRPPLAARPAARVASPRGQVAVVGVHRADGRPRPEQLVDERRRARGPVDHRRDPRRGRRATMAIQFPPQEYDLGRRPALDPARKQARPDESPFDWTVGESSSSSRSRIGSTGRIRRARSRSRPMRLAGRRPPGGPARDRRRGGRATASTGRAVSGGPRPAAAAAAPMRAARGEALAAAGEDVTSRPRAASPLQLDHTTLAIQGPPGSGKTYSGREDDPRLLAAGRRVGITATSHKVIGNLLEAVLDCRRGGGRRRPRGPARRQGRIRGPPDGVTRRGQRRTCAAALRTGPREHRRPGRRGSGRRPEIDGAVDVLFVDEAGQISLANVVADRQRGQGHRPARRSASSSDQPLRGSHPPGADRSALAHVLGDGRPCRRASRACSSRPTWRDAPGVCDFTSEVFYDDRLDDASGHPCRVRRRRRSGRSPGPASAAPRRPNGATDNESRDRGGGRARAAARSSTAGRPGSTGRAVVGRSRGTRS